MNYAFKLNEAVLKRPIVIYGAGALGLDCLIELLNLNLYVTCFCDASKEKQKIRILNKRIIPLEELYEMRETHNVIVAATSFREIGKTLEEKGIRHLFYYKDIAPVSQRTAMQALFFMNEEVKKRPVIIYGTGELAKACLNEFLNNGVDVDEFCSIIPEEQGITIQGKKVISPEELQLREDCNIVIAAEEYEDVFIKLKIEQSRIFCYRDIYKVHLM